MYVQTCFYEGDKLSKSTAEYIGKSAQSIVKPHTSVDYAKPFIFINGSNEHHNRTLEFVRHLPNIDGYIHIDHHDDIAISSNGSGAGPASFVESILSLGKIVIFVGQRYWSHKIWFKGKKRTMLLRNNLQRYRPLHNIFFLEKNGQYIFCPSNIIDKNFSIIKSALESPNIEKVFLLEEYSSKIDVSGKIEIFSRRDLRWKTSFPELYPALVLKWRGCRFNSFNLDEVYISIDLDVLKAGLVECDWQNSLSALTVEQIVQNLKQISRRSKVFAGDICGIASYHKATLRTIGIIYESLRKSIEYSRS